MQLFDFECLTVNTFQDFMSNTNLQSFFIYVPENDKKKSEVSNTEVTRATQ